MLIKTSTKLLAFMLTLVIGLAMTTLLAKSAQAYIGSCSVQYTMCFYKDINYSGNQYTFYLPNTCYNFPSGWDNVVSSVYNAWPFSTLYIYSDPNCTGYSKGIWGGSQGAGLSDLTQYCLNPDGIKGNCTKWNDKASSWKVL